LQKAFITGITGQDGSYLCELLLDRGYEVHGLVRDPARAAGGHLAPLLRDPALRDRRLFLHPGRIEDVDALCALVTRIAPTELYHLAGVSISRTHMHELLPLTEANGTIVVRLLDHLRTLATPPRFVLASSSEVFGRPVERPQTEATPLAPVTPYGVGKSLAQLAVGCARATFGLPAASAILFNHESPRRGSGFVTSKIADGVAAIKLGRARTLTLGNLAAERDWGWAPDYVAGMAALARQGCTQDVILATGELHTVEDFVRAAFGAAGLDWRAHVEFDPALVPAQEPARCCGNPARARTLLGWQNTVSFEAMVGRLVQARLERAQAA
jgi:GDPmannose 4,6-dehydratase